MVTVAFQSENSIDEVFEDAWAGKIAILGDVSDQHDGTLKLLRHLRQRHEQGPHVGVTVSIAARHERLHRVDEAQLGACLHDAIVQNLDVIP